MPRYVDCYVLPVPKKNLTAYRRMAQIASRVWRDHGALEYRECVGDDLNIKICKPFPRGIRAKPGETIVVDGAFLLKSHAEKREAGHGGHGGQP